MTPKSVRRMPHAPPRFAPQKIEKCIHLCVSRFDELIRCAATAVWCRLRPRFEGTRSHLGLESLRAVGARRHDQSLAADSCYRRVRDRSHRRRRDVRLCPPLRRHHLRLGQQLQWPTRQLLGRLFRNDAGDGGHHRDAHSIAAGSFHALAIRYDGSVWAWRDDAVGQLGDTSVYRRSSPARVEKGSTGAPVEPRLAMGGFGSRSERPSEGPGSAPRHFNAISTHRGATG